MPCAFAGKGQVSVVMPAYDSARTIAAAINSVLKQSYGDLELIICNDASRDGTSDLLKCIGDDRVKVIENATNRGEGFSRDRAIELAGGDWLAFIDADDAWDPRRLEMLLGAAPYPNKGVVVFDDILECHDSGDAMVPWKPIRGRHAFGKDYGTDNTGGDVALADYIRSVRLLIKPLVSADLIKSNNLRHSDIRFGADTEFFLKILSRRPLFRYVPEAMYFYRITAGSVSRNSEKHVLLRDVLVRARELFNEDRDCLDAIDFRILMEERMARYRPFLIKLKQGRYREALSMIKDNPWFVEELFKRTWARLPYEAHRIAHRGRSRGEG